MDREKNSVETGMKYLAVVATSGRHDRNVGKSVIIKK